MIKLIAGITAVAAATTVGIVVASESSSAGTLIGCQSRNLRPVFGGTDGTAGTLHDKWRLVNMGSATCTLTGFPIVHNYRFDGRPLPTSTTQQGKGGIVTLTAGQHASFTLSYPQPGNIGCTPEHAVRLTIQTDVAQLPLITDRGERSCHGQLTETPLVHGG
jgi:hypothetical protein